MRFVETKDGTLINLAHVRKIENFRHKVETGYRHSMRVTWADGSCATYEMPYGSSATLDLLQPIPAFPGFMLLAYYNDEGGEWISRYPIVAWELYSLSSGDFFLNKPIALEEPGDNAIGKGILAPDGQVTGDGRWDSEEEWLKDMRAQAALALKKHA